MGAPQEDRPLAAGWKVLTKEGWSEMKLALTLMEEVVSPGEEMARSSWRRKTVDCPWQLQCQ